MTRRSHTIFVVYAFVFLICSDAQADIYKCTAPDGSITYSQVPCPKQKTETIRSSAAANAAVDCDHANKFAFAAARLMQGGLSSTELFNRYGGVDALSSGSVNLINYVYGFRTNDAVSAERIAALTQAKCKVRSLGDVSCASLPLSYTDSIGGCDASQDELDAAERGSHAPQAPAAMPAATSAPSNAQATRASANQAREEQREQCKDRYRDQIDRIDAEMRRGYSSAQGEAYRERLRALTQQMRQC